MDLILCHTTADFDTLGAAVGLTRLLPGARIVLTGGCHPGVRDFLALHRDEYALIERRSVTMETVRSLSIVDTQWRDRLGKAAEWLDYPGLDITVYDHHGCDEGPMGDIAATHTQIEAVGATTTLIVEALRRQQVDISGTEATVMALGIHVDTGSLTFDHATPRDGAALTWLMEQGASQRAIADYVEPGLSSELQDLLPLALDQVTVEDVEGYALAWVLLEVEGYVQGLSSLASRLLSLMDVDVLLLASRHQSGEEERLTVIGRSHSGSDRLHLGELFRPWGGGGHARAASLSWRGQESDRVLASLVEQLRQAVPHAPTAQELMSSPVRTIRPSTTIGEAQRILLRYGHSGLSVVDEDSCLIGMISRRDLDIALHHDFSHAPVKGFMTTQLKTITPTTTLSDIEALMVTYDIGRLPVLDGKNLVGIVTRTDVLRQLHQEKALNARPDLDGLSGQESFVAQDRDIVEGRLVSCPLPGTVQRWLQQRLSPELWQLLGAIAQDAEARGWQIYLVGGAVRDLLLNEGQSALRLEDIDLVVDGVQTSADGAAGVDLARSLQAAYPQARLQIHGRFQTAALLWHQDPVLGSLWLDIATARTEFYPYPAANPEVEASSIRQDLYRRDFTINAMAIRLTLPRPGELLDFFGGLLDLRSRQIRVLHPNSFIEDPTRIFRAVRFAVRLDFALDPQTEGYIRHAIASGIYHRIQIEVDKTPALQTRLKQELRYILQAPYWRPALRLLADLGALCCIHPKLELSDRLWKQLQLLDRWLKRFDDQPQVSHWQILLEVLIAALPEGDRGRIASNLQLPTDSIERLTQLHLNRRHILVQLPQCQRPSHLFQLLQPYSLPTLVLLGATGDRALRHSIWTYLTRLSQVQSPLNGNDLKAMGYKPGRQFKTMIERLLSAMLDGEISDRASAEQLLRQHFPLETDGINHASNR
ncbi:MAG: CBS domain-containing protein [Leptolyngbya sp. DLM2.Bin15]|nr:MAG: CBS domain-containing protein [Leptolyngbya sp. DLM2.Bin15]